ncbi:Transposable element Tcb2 transposase [Anthophora plagiata]
MTSKKSEISVSLRDRVIFLRKSGESYRKIGKALNLNFTTVQYIVKKYEETRSTDNRPRSGRPKILTDRERRSVIKEVTKFPFISAQTLCNDVASTSGKNRYLFSDECKFNIFGSDGKKFVWRKPNTELQQRNIHTTVKHGGGNVMLWGCMGYYGVGNIAFIEESMNAEKYIDILRNNLPESTKKLRLNRTYYFQQDNDPQHTAKKTKEWLLYNVPKQLITPPQSPDINSIENLWHLLNIEIRKRKISNKTDLQRIILQEWPKISKEITKKLVESMPKRLQAIIDAKGMHTKY